MRKWAAVEHATGQALTVLQANASSSVAATQVARIRLNSFADLPSHIFPDIRPVKQTIMMPL
jgi:hypothetical protein